MMNFKEISDKKDELKRLFYSNLTANELMEKLEVSNNVYQKLLIEVKKELGLSSSYRRKPNRYGKYFKDAYYVEKCFEDDDFEIVYVCTYDDAINMMEGMNCECNVKQATDDNLKRVICQLWFEGWNWSDIMIKYKLPYHKFYSLFNSVKSDLGMEGVRTCNVDRYIHKNNYGRYEIYKTKNQYQINYGAFDELNDAIYIRNYLEDIDWDVSIWKKNKEAVLKEIGL